VVALRNFIPKKVITDQQYDSYWKLTVEYTDIYDSRFNNTLKMIVKFIDDNNLVNETYDMKYYKKLQDIIYSVYPKADKASVRKSINQFIKLGFIKPYLRGYHNLTKKFLNTTDTELKKVYFQRFSTKTPLLVLQLLLMQQTQKKQIFY
jgi:hypothetical protein